MFWKREVLCCFGGELCCSGNELLFSDIVLSGSLVG